MVYFLSILSSALLASIAIAQEPTSNFNQSVVSQVAGEIDPGTKASWCNGQQHACNVLCNKSASNNTCTPSTLTFTCTCSSNNSSPMFQYYEPTMVSFICNRYLGDCLAATAMHADEQAACQQQIVCGNSSVDAYANSTAGQSSGTNTASTSTGTGTATATTGTTGTTGSTSSTATPTTAKSSAAGLEIRASYATGIFGTILLGIFGLAL